MRTLAARIGAPFLLVFTLGCNERLFHDINGPSDVTTIGSGNFVTVTRAVDGFNSIDISAGGRAIVTPGGSESLEITAEDNILPLVEAVVVNGRLVLGFKPGSGSMSAHGVVYRIGVRTLRDVRGSSGSRIEIEGLNASQFAVDLSSGATFTASGSVDRFELDLSSGSRVNAPALATRVANARLSSGSVSLMRVSDLLLVNASSASVLEYFGNPEVQAQTSSGATVRRVGS